MSRFIILLKKGFLLLFAGVPYSSQIHYRRTKRELEEYVQKSDKERLSEDYRNIGQDLFSVLTHCKKHN